MSEFDVGAVVEDVTRANPWLLTRSRPTPSRPRVDGFVYFIRAVNGGPIKIGWTRDVPHRRSELQIASPYRLIVLAELAGGRRLEREMHDLFDHLHVRGEWFRPAPELLRFVEEISR